MVSVMEEEPHPEDSANFLQPAKLYESDYSSGEDYTVAVIENSVEKVEPLNMPIKIGNINTTLLVDSGSAWSTLNRSLALQVVQSNPRALWITEQMSPKVRIFSNEPIQVEGKIQASIEQWMDLWLCNIHCCSWRTRIANWSWFVRSTWSSCDSIYISKR